MKRRIFRIITALALCLSLLPAAAWAEDTDLTIYIKSPGGQSATLTLAPATTITEVKTKIASEFSISFDDGYRLYCGDVENTQLNATDKTTLSDYGFESGDTINVEKSTWTATAETPIQIFGLTITGGVGAQEPYGSYRSADYYWNYYYKTITIRSATIDKNITISGTAEAGSHIIINGSGWQYVTLDNVSLSNSTGGCITLNPGSWLCLTLEGNNTLVTTGGNAPALALNNTYSYLWIGDNSTGTLTATSTCANMPGIGTCLESDTVFGIVMKGGTVTAKGGEGAPGLRANDVQIDGGTLTAVAGSEGVPGVVATTGTITLGTGMEVVAPAGGAVQADAYKSSYDIIAVDTNTIAKTVTVAPIISRTITVTGTADSPTQVTLNTAIDPGSTGGAVTYAKSTTNTAPTDGWQTSNVFTGLAENTTYYFFAKVEASGNYAAAVSAGTPITTPVKAVSGIEVITQPDKLTYTTGETLDLTGLTVKVTYNDGTEETISDLTNLSTDPASGASLTVTGNNSKPVTITYGSKTCTTNNLTVDQGSQTALSIAGVPEKIESGDSFILTAEGGTGTGEITWSVVSGPAEIDQNGTVTVTGTGEITVKAMKAGDAEYEQTECSVTFTAVKKPSPGVTTYPVTVEDAPHGTAKVDRTRAASGTTVIITVTPDEGYELDTLTVTDAKGNELALTPLGDGKYSFKMPYSKVTVSATFVETDPEPVLDPVKDCPKDETCPAAKFEDVKLNEWYHDGVHYCIVEGLMNGTGETTFEPDSATDRAMLVTVLYRLEGQPEAGDCPFTDVRAGEWYTDAITWAAENKIVEGYGDGTFGPEDPITREQFATILYRYAKYKGYDVSAKADITTFVDGSDTEAWAADAMAWAVAEKLINGIENNQLDPQGDAIRAQMATILMRFCELV